MMKKIFCLIVVLFGTVTGCNPMEVRPWNRNDLTMIYEMYTNEELIQLRNEVKEIGGNNGTHLP
jgi:hypothetical protein